MNGCVTEHYDSLLYSRLAEEYFSGSDYANFGYWEPDTAGAREASENLVRRLLEFIPRQRGAILDVACGKGATTRHLLRHYSPAAITAINLSERQLETARANAPGCRFVLGDATDLPFADASFDDILCVEAAFHFHTRELFLQEALRVLKPGGRLVLSDVLMSRKGEETMSLFHLENYLPSPQHYRALGERVGFREVAVHDATAPCWHGHYHHIVRFMHQKYLDREADLPALRRALENTYRITPHVQWYLLASLQKG